MDLAWLENLTDKRYSADDSNSSLAPQSAAVVGRPHNVRACRHSEVLMGVNPTYSRHRTQLYRELSQAWDWRTDKGLIEHIRCTKKPTGRVPNKHRM